MYGKDGASTLAHHKKKAGLMGPAGSTRGGRLAGHVNWKRWFFRVAQAAWLLYRFWNGDGPSL